MAAIGKILQGMGPGLLSGIGNAVSPSTSQPKMIPNAPHPDDPKTAKPNTFKHGGVVEKTGVALVHKGEVVIPAHKAHQLDTVNLSHHRVVMHLRKGGLHRALHVPEGEDIPADKLAAAKNSNNEHVRRMATLAETMKSWHKK